MMVLEEFFDNYFKLIKEVNDFHFEYLVSNKFKFPKANYLELKRFNNEKNSYCKPRRNCSKSN